MPMNCPDCDARLEEDAQFCHRCGREVASGDDAARSEVAETPRQRPRAARTAGDETLLWEGSFSAKGLINSWLLAMLITVVLPAGGLILGATQLQWLILMAVVAIVWLGLGALLGYHKLNVHYELTDQRLIHRSGILWRRTDRIELIDMDDVSHEQGLIERMFDVGTILIASSDRTHPAIYLPGISNVERVAALIDDARRQERIRRGIHIEAI